MKNVWMLDLAPTTVHTIAALFVCAQLGLSLHFDKVFSPPPLKVSLLENKKVYETKRLDKANPSRRSNW